MLSSDRASRASWPTSSRRADRDRDAEVALGDPLGRLLEATQAAGVIAGRRRTRQATRRPERYRRRSASGGGSARRWPRRRRAASRARSPSPAPRRRRRDGHRATGSIAADRERRLADRLPSTVSTPELTSPLADAPVAVGQLPDASSSPISESAITNAGSPSRRPSRVIRESTLAALLRTNADELTLLESTLGGAAAAGRAPRCPAPRAARAARP